MLTSFRQTNTIEVYHEHTRASKKNHLGVKFPGYNPKNLPAAFGGRKIFRQPCRPRVQNDQNFFTHGIPMVYSQGSFISTFLPGLTTQGSFLRFFLIFSEFSWFFPIFHEFLPKILPAAFGGQKFFPPLGS